jgi:hypothetical protein
VSANSNVLLSAEEAVGLFVRGFPARFAGRFLATLAMACHSGAGAN